MQRVLPELTLAEGTEFVATLGRSLARLPCGRSRTRRSPSRSCTVPILGWSRPQACVDLTPRLRWTADILLASLIPSRNPAHR